MTNSLLNNGTLISAMITAIATFVIMVLTYIQKNIANLKRKDDLFGIRWEFYQEIIKFIRNIDFHLDELIYCNQAEKNKEILWNSVQSTIQEIYAEHYPELDQYQINKKSLEVYENNLKKLDIYNNLQIMLALYDTTQGNISFCEETFLKAREFIQKSKYLFGNDISEFLKKFLSIDNLEKTYQRYYLNAMECFGLDNDLLKKRIEIYGWSVTTDSCIRGSQNKIPEINKISTLQHFEKENTEDLNKLNKFINFLKDKSITFRTVAGLFEDNPDFKELEEKFDKYLKLDNQFLKRFFRWKK